MLKMLLKKQNKSTTDIVDKQLSVMNNAFIWISIIVVILTVGLGLFSFLRIDSLQSQIDNQMNKQDARIQDALLAYEKRIDRMEDKLEERITNYIDKSNSEFKEKISDFRNDFEKLAGETLKIPVLEILYFGSELKGQIIEVNKSDDGWIDMPAVVLFNSGTKESQLPSINISFSEEVHITGNWNKTIALDPNFNFQYQLELGSARDDLSIIKVGEYDRLEPFRIKLNSTDTKTIRCKIEIFYEAPQPTVAIFTIKII